jgi:hypothetical protein
MIRAVGLNKDLPGTLPTPSPACELQQQLKRLLPSPEIGTVQQAISCQHGSERDARQVHPLRQHLGSNQNIRFTSSKLIQQTPMSVASTGGVAIKTQQSQALQLRLQLFQNPLSASAEGLKSRRTTVPTGRRHRGSMITPVATQPLVTGAFPMNG